MTKTTRKRLIIWSVTALILLVVLSVALRPQPVPVDLGQVSEGALEVTLDHEGVTRVRDRFAVSAPVQGRVLRIELEPGDPVVAGKTVLARFLPAAPVPLDARLRAESRARVKVAQAALERARAERAQVQSEQEFAQADWTRARALADGGILSLQERDRAESAVHTGAKAVEAAEAAVQAALHDLEAANAAMVEPVAPSGDGPPSPAGTLALRSPVDGVVLRRLRESEAVVAPGEPLLEVADPGALEVIADYLSSDAVRIRPGMPVRLEQWGGEKPIHGRVRRVEPAGFMKVSALGVEEQRVWVVIDLIDPREAWLALGDGYRVQTRVVVWRQDRVLTVPTGALFRQGDAWAVFVGEAGRARLRRVEIGERNGIAAEVRNGLVAGDRVVRHPPDTVTDGTRVIER